MHETLIYSVTENLLAPLPRTMSNDWNGDWFTADLTNYGTLLANLNGAQSSRVTQAEQISSTHVSADYVPSFQYEYNPPFNEHGTDHLPLQAGASMEVDDYNTRQQLPQHMPSSVNANSRFVPQFSSSGTYMSTERSHPSTPAATLFSAILPSQQLRTKSTSSSASPYTPQQSKRNAPDAEGQEATRSPKRRASDISAFLAAQDSGDILRPNLELSEEERLLVQLKQDQNLPWKEIAKEFEGRFGRPFQVPALQMRYKRLRERLRPWTKEDIAALEAAYEHWETNKFEIIANKMLDFGVQDRWPARYCERKWEQLHPEASGPDPGNITAERPRPQHTLPARFDTDLENHSIEWPIPSPRDAHTSQATTPQSGAVTTQSMILPPNPFLTGGSGSQQSQSDFT